VTAISLFSGGPVPRYFAMRLEFFAVAVSKNLREKVPFQEEENKPGTFSGRRKKINPAPFPSFSLNPAPFHFQAPFHSAYVEGGRRQRIGIDRGGVKRIG
jgi:hypothetical protein